MVKELTDVDRRAAALVARNGYAAAVPYKTYWLSGGHRIAKTTVSRLLAARLVARDPEARKTRIIPAEGLEEVVRPGDLPDTPPTDGSGYWPEAAVRRGTGENEDDPETWAPPEYVDERGRPVPVDLALEDEG